MPRIACFTLIVVQFLACNPSARAEADHDVPDRRPDFRIVEERIRELVETEQIPSLAYAVTRHGEFVTQGAAGWADREQKVTSSALTPYPLASASKPIVATAALILHQNGQIDLDRPVSDALGHPAWVRGLDRSAPVSLKHLLGHTSGLGPYARIYWRDQDLPVEDLETMYARHLAPAFEPGTVFEYSNLGYGLIGTLLEKAQDRPLSEILSERVFKPLGMEQSGLVDSFITPAGAARKYGAGGDPLVETYNDTPAAGNVYASAHDLARFGNFHLHGRTDDHELILNDATRHLMQEVAFPDAVYPYYSGSGYGLGWYIRERGPNGKVLWHEGGMPGGSSILVLLPESGIVVAVLINATAANPHAQEIANALIRVMEADHETLVFEATEGMEPFAGQAGLTGDWRGTVQLEQRALDLALEFGDDGLIHVEFPELTDIDDVPATASFPALYTSGVLVATAALSLPGAGVDMSADGYVLFRLVRNGDSLNGVAAAYAAPQRLEHIYPYRVHLNRVVE